MRAKTAATLRLWLMAALVVTTAACTEQCSPEDVMGAKAGGGGDVVTADVMPTYCPGGPGACFAVSPAPDMQEACPETRWIGRVASGNDCPAPAQAQGGSWLSGRLFPVAPGETPPDAGQVFCWYEWSSTGGQPDLVALPSDGADPAPDWLDRDCQSLAALGGTDAHEALAIGWATMNSAFHDQVEWLPSLPTPLVASPRVRVAVLDSAPHSAPGQNRHGHVVGLTIEELACPLGPGATCAVDVVNHLALHLEEPFDPNFSEGGNFGTISRVAQTLFTALEAWHASGPAGQHLIINLSVGWNGYYNNPDEVAPGTPSTTERAAVDAVRFILEEAVCQGAIVIAAAGNASGGDIATDGPMYPAAWESEVVHLPCGAATTHPARLVYAAGGVDGEDAALGNTRPGGRPRLAAPASEVVVFDPLSASGPSEVLTGTSMAAAVVSAVAAVVWSNQPGLAADRVMALVYDTAEPLSADGPADFCLGGGPCTDDIRRVSVCRAALAAQTGAYDHCLISAPDPATCVAPSLTCTPHAAYSGSLPVWTSAELVDLDSFVNTCSSGTRFDATVLTDWLDVPFCGTALLTDATAPTTDPCPEQQYVNGNLAPWAVWPQPGITPCEMCLARPNLTRTDLTVALNDNLKEKLWNPVLVLDTGETADLSKFAPSGLIPGDVYVFEGIGVDISRVKSARIEFSVSSGGKSYAVGDDIIIQ